MHAFAAPTLAPGFAMTTVVGGMGDPLSFDWAPNGDLYIAEKSGKVRLFRTGTLSLMGTIPVSTTDELGITAIEVDPDFATNHFLWITYSTPSPVRQRLARFTIVNDTLTGEVDVLEYAVTNALHHAGCIRFADDGTLFVSTGDDGLLSVGSQDKFNLRGKILHINRDGTPAAGNPFGAAQGDPRVWALGLRHPWRFTLQPETGTLFIADVGGSDWEELDLGIPGANYGWSTIEGPSPAGQAGFVYPIYWYPHSNPAGASIMAGPFATAADFNGEFTGQFFFGDEAARDLRRMTLDASNNVVATETWATDLPDPVEIRFGPDGALYFVSFNNGALYRIARVGGANRQPQAVGFATPASGLAPLQVTLDGTQSSDPDTQQTLQYSWDSGHGATGTTPTLAHLYPAGVYLAHLTVSDGQGGTDTTPDIRIVSGNRAPVPTISAPADESHYDAGDTIAFTGGGTDPEDGTVPCSRFTWSVVFHHAGHTHPHVGPIEGVCSGSFAIPRTGETSADTYYEVILTVRDSGAPLGTAGALDTTTAVQVRPNTSTLTFTTTPHPNLLITLDGTLQPAPITTSGVVDFLRSLGAPATQTGPDGRTYTFAFWSDGGMMNHTITTPATPATWTATFDCSVITEVTGVQVNTAPGGQVALTWQPISDLCAATSGVRYYVYAAATARPATPPGSFPGDPAFALRGMVTTESFTYVPNPSDAFFLVVAVGSDGSPGKVGHYGS
ncbi:MAG TPA: PQQ-dependent sugar dehydrogenase [Candidatus Polarisedimenticolia bacterium]|nr:PQQ-dependent sugar dehydrogenase [Candidatus Polarisedimenticolia bacterium]